MLVDQIATFGLGQIIAMLFALLCLVISGFVSGSEISYFSLDSADLDELEESHPSKGEQITGIMSKPEKFLATILIANNLVNITIVIILSYALTPLFEGMPEWAEFVLQTVLLTFLILLFGEIIPKLYANNNPKGWALSALPGIKAMLKIFSPLSSLLVKSNWLVNKVVTRRAEKISADELSQALELTSIQEGEQKEMLEGILKFGDTTASEIMTPRVDITDISIATPFDKVMEIVIESGYARIPVYENTQDDIKGVLYSRDLLPFVDNRNPDFEWQSLIRKPYFVPESRQIDDLLEDFRKLKIHLAIVIDEYGGTQGIVTLEDVLEEIVGDIDDEYDDEEKSYQRLADNTYIFEGKTLLTDFFRITEQDPELYEPVAADCETLAGMLLAIKGDFPKEKEPMVYGRCRFLVLDVEHHRIASVRVKVMDENQHI